MSGFRLFWGLACLAALAVGCGGRAAGEPAILFLRPAGDGGAAQLFLLAGDGPPRQLTGVDDPAAPAVIDFAAAPDGARIAYSVAGAGGTALRIVERDGGGDALLLDCPAAECVAPVWAPGSRQLIFERRDLAGTVPGPPRLAWLDADTGATRPLITGDDTTAYGPRFSPDGEWLSYVSPADEGIVLFRPDDGAQRLLTSRAGSPVAWSPDGAAVVYGDVVPAAHEQTEDGAPPLETAGIYLYRTLLAEEGSRERLSPETAVADGGAAFSPDGQWIAFTRAPAETGAPRQLWLMRPDGRDARALTAEVGISQGPPSWSADGRWLLYQRVDTADPDARPAVWRLAVDVSAAELLAADGYLPAWLPAP